MNNLSCHIVVEIGGMDLILWVVKLDYRFDVSKLNAIVLVAFLRSIAEKRLNGRLILSHCC